jgi:NAD(P)-dependent dehydrogenase (short-subunit alcohol dehydrogenase family)
MTAPVALIVGAGPGISGAFASRLVARGYAVALAARHLGKLEPLATSMNCRAYAVDAGSAAGVSALFSAVERDLEAPDVILFNAGALLPGSITELNVDAVAKALQTNAMGAFAVAQEAARRMLPRGRGAIFFTGATASVKGFARFSAFAMGKFAVRGLAQSLARELAPQGIHVAHFVIDGVVIGGDGVQNFTADNIAASYLAVLDQPPGAWSWEIELRSHKESF